MNYLTEQKECPCDMKQLNHKQLKSAKARALREAKRRCKGKSERERHQLFIQLWQSNLAEVV